MFVLGAIESIIMHSPPSFHLFDMWKVFGKCKRRLTGFIQNILILLRARHLSEVLLDCLWTVRTEDHLSRRINRQLSACNSGNVEWEQKTCLQLHRHLTSHFILTHRSDRSIVIGHGQKMKRISSSVNSGREANVLWPTFLRAFATYALLIMMQPEMRRWCWSVPSCLSVGIWLEVEERIRSFAIGLQLE